MKSISLVLVACGFLLTFFMDDGFSQDIHTKTNVTLIEVLSDRGAHDGVFIQVSGYFCIINSAKAILMSPQECRDENSINAIELSFADGLDSPEALNERITMVGVFRSRKNLAVLGTFLPQGVIEVGFFYPH